MTITEEKQGSVYTLILKGNLDTSTAPQLEQALGNITDDITQIVFDITEVDYISSAGLRAILLATEIVGEDGTLTVKGANPMVQDIFDATGFSSMLNME